jgi:hypothetical protein
MKMVNNIAERMYAPLTDTEFRTVYATHEHLLTKAKDESNALDYAYYVGILEGLRLGLNPMEAGAVSGWIPIS